MDVDQVVKEVSLAANADLKPILITDSVGSMGGLFPIRQITDIVGNADGFVYFDDAHGTSVFGKQGQGYVLQELASELPPHVIMVGSLSKAFGSHGGFVATKFEDTNRFIRQFGSSYVFGGPPSLPGLAACVAAGSLHLDGTVGKLQVKLQDNLKVFDNLRQDTINHGTEAPIRGIRVGDEFDAIDLAHALHSKGYMATAAMFPTVKKGEAILRCAISAQHQISEIEGLLSSLQEIEESYITKMSRQ